MKAFHYTHIISYTFMYFCTLILGLNGGSSSSSSSSSSSHNITGIVIFPLVWLWHKISKMKKFLLSICNQIGMVYKKNCIWSYANNLIFSKVKFTDMIQFSFNTTSQASILFPIFSDNVYQLFSPISSPFIFFFRNTEYS